MQPEGLPSAAPILDLLNGFRRSKVLFTLVSLRVPEILSHRQSATIDQILKAIADTLQYEPSRDGLGRLLDSAVAMGLLAGNREGYVLTDLASVYLVPDSEFSLVGYVLHSDRILYKLWSGLETSVCTGTNCWSDAFGLDSRDVFSSVYNKEEDVIRFMHGMHAFSKLSAESVLTAFDLSGFSTLVDLGGASGALAIAACQMYPALRAVVVDLPHVIDKSRQHFTKPPFVQQQEVLDRLSWTPADFFSPDTPVPQGDLYIMARILHDWEEARCLRLLRTVYEKLPLGMITGW